MRQIAIVGLAAVVACTESPAVGPLVPDARDVHASVAPSNPRFLRPPFAGDRPLLNWFDHAFPQQGVDNNQKIVTTWNESISTQNIGIDGHQGYDWQMPVGTTLRSVAAGTVVFAGIDAPFSCQALGGITVTNQKRVIIQHVAPGLTVDIHYVHLNTIGVSVGQAVATNAVIGTSGNTGCSNQPHLHFEVRKHVGLAKIVIDPYGWTSAATDPWATHPSGTESVNLWATGVAPARFREVAVIPNPSGSTALVTITKVRWMGVDDATNRNNEFIDLTLDTNFGSSASLNGFEVRGDRANFIYVIPPGITLTTASPTVRVFTGSGTNTATQLFMNRPPVWSNNFDDCARRVNTTPNPDLHYVISLGADSTTCHP